MKKTILILICISIIFGCITSKDITELTIDKTILYTIGEDGKWGYANAEGESIIEPQFDEVNFFTNGVALVKNDGKYGYLKKDGNWHIKPKYDLATSFLSNCASVTVKSKSVLIDRKGREVKLNDRYPIEGGCCKIILPVDPNKYFKSINGKYELEYKFYLKIDSINYIGINDTTNLKIDQIIEFGNEYILLRKDNKYGLFDIRSHRKIVIDKFKNSNHKIEAQKEISKLIEFKYDDVVIERFFANEISYAKVRTNNKYGVINSRGLEIMETEFISLEIMPRRQMVLVEYEKSRFGCRKFDNKEFFKRNESIVNEK